MTINQSYLKTILQYNETTGLFIWLMPTTNHVKIGDIAGSKNKKGYITIGVNNKHYYAHRLAWLYEYGDWPENQIDHINGNKSDNKIENLKIVNNRQNHKNKTIHRIFNKLVGTSFKKGKWESSLQYNKKTYYLGRYKTEIEANEIYNAVLYLLDARGR